ncbi:MAG: c-type cytochrome [Halopseudomonas sp.]
MMKARLIALVSAVCISSAVQARSFEETLAFCEDCHGEGGVSQESDVPTMAGFSDIAISDILIAYRDGSRSAISSKFRGGDTSRSETNMNEITKEMSDAEIEQLAEHYSSKTFVPSKQTFDPALAANGFKIHKVQCTKCHEDGGTSRDDDVGLLAGQWSPYLRTALTNFRNDKRETEPKMLKLVKKLDDSEIESLLNYWASQQ